MRKYVMALVIFCVGLIAANMAMTFVVVELSKETHTDASGVMKVAGTDTTVETASSVQPSKLHSGLPNAAFKVELCTIQLNPVDP